MQPRMQEILKEKFESIFMPHLENPRFIPAHLCVIELFRNNIEMLTDTDKIKEFSERIVSSINELETSSYMRCQLLESFKVLVYYKKKVLLKNQTIVMDKLTHKQFKNIIFLPNDSKALEKLKACVSIYENAYTNNMKIITIDPYLDYFSNFLYLLAVLCEDRNAATESKCQKFFEIGDLVLLCNLAKDCWYLKRNIMLFYFHVYCETEMEISEFQEDYNLLSEFVVDDWHDICQTFSSDMLQKVKTYHGIEDLSMIRDDYLFNILAAVIDIQLQASVYKPEKGDNHRTKKEMIT